MFSDSMRFHLRECTAAAHARLDASIGVFDSRSAYRHYLSGMLGFREAAEDAVTHADYPGWFGKWRPRSIAAALRADMADLGMTAPAEPYRRRDLGPALDNPAALLGTLYVLEGSALGARLLYARAIALGLDEEFGARHLSLQTQDKDSWRDFVNILERAGAIVGRAEAVRASLDAFDLAERRLCGNLATEEL